MADDNIHKSKLSIIIKDTEDKLSLIMKSVNNIKDELNSLKELINSFN